MQNREPGLANPWFQLALSIGFVTAYEVLLKLGAIETAQIAGRGWAWTGLSGLASVYVWLGIPLVILSLITWLYVLRHLALSIAFPISQAVHAFVPLASWLILGESINKLRWSGIILVLLGLALVAKPVARMEERL
jgi:undecaprenyl phosphate-alpha-L-ara4N flippase subunit ArnF